MAIMDEDIRFVENPDPIINPPYGEPRSHYLVNHETKAFATKSGRRSPLRAAGVRPRICRLWRDPRSRAFAAAAGLWE